MDFKGRATVASVKNAQFVESIPITRLEENEPNTLPSVMGPIMQKADVEQEFLLQLGKTTEDCFNMDFRHPLSLLQAFSIAVSR